jgi:asparagine synthase (glutamine-hydrolysing)
MCGIAGLLNAPGEADVSGDALARMRDRLAHRGPDASGVLQEGRLGLCHTRLSILDLSPRARQPMVSSSGRYVLSFNGEIYNFRTLRDELVRCGRRFRTEGDSEVILELMEHGGLDALDALRGMFAFAIYDRDRGELALVRDRLGIKPLFYTQGPHGVAFASEPKALPDAHAAATLPPARIAEYLAFRHLAEAESLLPHVRTLGPGERLVTNGRDVKLERYWEAPGPAGGDPERTQACIDDAVRRQLVSDVPVGVFLSGGVDSALVTAAAADASPRIDTFTVGFDEAGWDESERSRVVAEALDTRRHVIRLEPEHYVRDLGRAIWHLDSPLNHAHSVHLLQLSAYAKERVTVALTGEGGDELFGGYPRYRLHLLALALGRAPGALLAAARRLAGAGHGRLARTLDAAARGDAGAAAVNAAFVPLAEAAALTGCARADEIIAPRLAILARCARRDLDPVTSLLALERRTYMVSLLQRMDRMSMAAGLECRVPLLDEAVFDHAASLAPRDLVRFGDTKIPLRRAVERRFGRRYANLPKSGFGVPVGAWLRGDTAFRHLADGVLRDRRTRERGWTDSARAVKLLDDHCAGRADHAEALWGLLNLELWARICLEDEGPGLTASGWGEPA